MFLIPKKICQYVFYVQKFSRRIIKKWTFSPNFLLRYWIKCPLCIECAVNGCRCFCSNKLHHLRIVKMSFVFSVEITIDFHRKDIYFWAFQIILRITLKWSTFRCMFTRLIYVQYDTSSKTCYFWLICFRSSTKNRM